MPLELYFHDRQDCKLNGNLLLLRKNCVNFLEVECDYGSLFNVICTVVGIFNICTTVSVMSLFVVGKVQVLLKSSLLFCVTLNKEEVIWSCSEEKFF